jgi:hypothetical protein
MIHSRCANISRCCAATVRRPAVSAEFLRSHLRAPAESRDNPPAQVANSNALRHFSPIIFRAAPFFPGTLLMNLNLQLAAALAAEFPRPAAGRWDLRTISDVKLRSFIPPGEQLELEAKLDQTRGKFRHCDCGNVQGEKTCRHSRAYCL